MGNTEKPPQVEARVDPAATPPDLKAGKAGRRAPARRIAGQDGKFWRQGEPMVWTTAAALAAMLLMTATLLVVIMVNGLGVFWPSAVAEVTLADGTRFLGIPIASQTNPNNGVRSMQFKTGNRELDPRRQDFHWVSAKTIRRVDHPAGAVVLERVENGDFYGFLRELKTPTLELPAGGGPGERFHAALAVLQRRRREVLEPLAARLSALSDQLDQVSYATMKVDYQRDRAAAEGGRPEALAALDVRRQELQTRGDRIGRQSQTLVAEQAAPGGGVAAKRGGLCRRARHVADYRAGRRGPRL